MSLRVESTPKDNDVVHVISQPRVEREGGLVPSAHHELKLRHPPRHRPLLTRSHQRSTHTLPALVPTNSQVVDPGAVPVVADHRGSKQLGLAQACEHGRVRTA